MRASGVAPRGRRSFRKKWVTRRKPRSCRILPDAERGRALGEAAVGAQHLPVDPAAAGAGQERDRVRDVLGLAQTLERSQLAELIDLGVGLAFEKELGPHRARRP